MTRTPAETNQIIHEAMGNYHRHEWEKSHFVEGGALFTCRKCDCGVVAAFKKHLPVYVTPPNYLEHGTAWGDLIVWVMEQSWWRDFKYWLWSKVYNKPFPFHGSLPEEVIANPRSLAEHIAEYLSKEEGR